ncbi:hypothetical protein [Arcanobacterium hippocoleae]|uniref:Primosomal protein N' (Replication factor Y) n=1 Tax=Arcanobacterium hippocoleae TaxID=149017 RepID=A0ABU1T048_9ACTO|nr:hypothetical protein [Arcanobacterium hippocoleae]MDR6938762.1 primosomal protein N' (replication factor Y) [Arcanobacterium hippocoleae]
MGSNTKFSRESLLQDLPQFSKQTELLSVAPMPVNIDSSVHDPIARIYPDIPLPHMSQLFDYEIPPRFADLSVGARVKISLGGQKVTGIVAERCATTVNNSKLREIESVISNVPVLQPQLRELLECISLTYFSPIAELFRLAIPGRHARAEKEYYALPPAQAAHGEISDDYRFPQYYQDAAAFSSGDYLALPEQTLLHLLPSDDIEIFVPCIKRVLCDAGTVLLLAPTAREVERIAAKIKLIFPDISLAKWSSDNSHAARYTMFLSALEGRTRIIIGTRVAIWAPLKDLKLIIQFDDSHSAYRERRSPYLDARDVLRQRTRIESAKFCIAAYGPSIPALAGMMPIAAQVQRNQQIHDGALKLLPAGEDLLPKEQVIMADLAARKGLLPQVLGANQFQYEAAPWSRMPSSLYSVVREGLNRDAVLIVVPQAGYIPKLACLRCGEIAVCTECGGRLQIPAPNRFPECIRCGLRAQKYCCVHCQGQQLKSSQVGSERTAFEIGRAFPSVPINLTASQNVNTAVKAGQIVVATPGNEPRYHPRYAAAVVFDCGYLLSGNSLNTEAQFLRTIAKTMSFVKPRSEGGKILLIGAVPTELINVIGRWEYLQWEVNAFAERTNLGLPPAHDWIEVSGSHLELRKFLGLLQSMITESIAKYTAIENHRSSTVNLSFAEESSAAQIIDPLSTGGSHEVLIGAKILGPNTISDNLQRIYLVPENEFRYTYLAVIDRINRIASAQKLTPGLRICRNPAL